MQQSETIQAQIIPFHTLQIQTDNLLGSGTYGDVYKAQWHGTVVAIKHFHVKTLSHTLNEEFLKEAQIMSQCIFPNVVTLYGICAEVGHSGLVMEYMPRGSLYEFLGNKNEEISWSLRWEIAIDIGKGISYLHSKDIIHRDLKSLNVLLGADYHAKICDFGISKIQLGSNRTNTYNKLGTARWRAPETFKRKFTPASSMDVYSYGMVLWEIITREIPFSDARDEVTVISYLVKEKPEKEPIPTDCPKAYGAEIEKCWEEANKRPSAQEVVSNLTRAKPAPGPSPTTPLANQDQATQNIIKQLEETINQKTTELTQQEFELTQKDSQLKQLEQIMSELQKSLEESRNVELKLKTQISKSQKPILKSHILIITKQLEKQNELTKALLSGNFELVKTLEKEGASFLYQDKDGCYPLVAAVYGCNLELVRYIEENLKGDAAEQWAEVDLKVFADRLDSQIPTPLSQKPTYGELGNWYIEYEKASWCATYDLKVLQNMGCGCWAEGDKKSWNSNGREKWLQKEGNVKINGNGYMVSFDSWRRAGTYELYSPSVKVHEDVVKAIREQLNELRNDVNSKCQKSLPQQPITISTTTPTPITTQMQMNEYQKQPSFSQNYHTGQSPIYNNNVSNNSPKKPTLKADVLISAKQLGKQNELTKALLSGNFELVKTLEAQGASFLYPDKDGCYPLVAAVYGCNLELVIKYIEKQIKGDAVEQWQKVDVKEFANKFDSQMPTLLSHPIVHQQLGAWYSKYKDTSWCDIYDREVLKIMNCKKWGYTAKYWSNREASLKVFLSSYTEKFLNLVDVSEGRWQGNELYSPSFSAHENAVKIICDQLNKLRKYVELKVDKQSTITNNF